jgi:hypothetical protein
MQKFASILLAAILSLLALPAPAQETEPWNDSDSKYKIGSQLVPGLSEF